MTTTDESKAALTETAPRKPPSLWRNRDFLLLWSGQAISTVGTQVSQLAFPLLVLFLTGSPAQAGFTGALRALPYFFLSLPGGALIDRWDRKRVMILCDSGRALALGSIPLVYTIFGAVPIIQVYFTALIEGTLFVFFNIAEAACLPRVVAQEQLPAATAQNQAADGTSYLLGPSLSGALYAFSHLLPFLADATSYAVSVASLFLIRTPFQGERSAAPRKLRAEIAEGLLWLWRQPLIRFMAFLSGSINFLAAGSSLVVIVLAQRQGASAPIIGLILGIAGVGSILGSLVGPAIQKRFSFGQAIIATVWVNMLAWPVYAVAPNPLALGVISAILYINGPIYNVVNLSYRVALTPDALQGRANSVVRLISFGAIPLGLALTGVLLQRLGPVTTVLVFAAGYVLLAVMTTLNPHVRHARPLAEVKTAGG